MVKELLSRLIHKSFRAGVLANLNNDVAETDMHEAMEIRDEILSKQITLLNGEQVFLENGSRLLIYEDEMIHVCGSCQKVMQIVRPGKYQCVNCE